MVYGLRVFEVPVTYEIGLSNGNILYIEDVIEAFATHNVNVYHTSSHQYQVRIASIVWSSQTVGE